MLGRNLVVFLTTYCLYVSAKLDIDTLEIVHIIFRHGEKNPDMKNTYPGDPHINETFYPFLQGQLNMVGRRTMYDLGHALRNTYHQFLGEIYSPNIIEAWSSPYPRCGISLQLVMASLFQPSKIEKWNEHLNWQPTLLYQYASQDEDKLFTVVMTDKYKSVYWKVCREDKSMQSELEKFKPWLKYIEDHVGLSKDCARTVFEVYSILACEHEANLKLPDWTKPIFPKILRELVEIEFQHQIRTRKLKKMLIGNLLNKILNDTDGYIYGRSEKKFHLYAGHEMNIIHILLALGFKFPQLPGYGAYLAIEVHKIEDEHVLKVLRHGEKNADLSHTYPGDPNLNVTYYPFLQGQLNLMGRQTAYDLGTTLRKRYHEFLEDVYSTESVEAWTSYFVRNIFTLQLVMAGLFPPNPLETWNENLNWQPTLQHISRKENDKIVAAIMNLYTNTANNELQCEDHALKIPQKKYLY